ncbi:MAG: MetQ/NlpA family ABC transporter substrate-binding protein [Oscillospiraceae bacterium]|nr:MetQ/NlpA family ABC transporter substrate-binding protein [Oscillospiraceae bacterium]
MKKLLAIALILTLALSFAACGSKTEETQQTGDTAAKQTVVKLGVIGENNEYWQPVVDELAKEGVTLQFVTFSDYSLPNKALADGEIDLNAFQHYKYFNNECATQGYDLVAIGETVIAPLSLYSDYIKDISEIKDGDKIAIASDSTNGGRAIKLLESLGFLEVDPSVGWVPSVSDITKYNVKIELVELEASNIPAALPDVTAAFINGAVAIDAGLKPNEDAIYMEKQEEGSENPYINIIAARAEDANNELYLHIVDLFRSDAVAKIINEQYGGALVPVWE